MRPLPAALLLSLALALPGRAQSLYGPGGLFLHPTASLPEKGTAAPAVLGLPQRNPRADAVRTWISGSVSYGLLEDLELGATVVKVTNWDRDASAGGFVKWRALRESGGRPAVAVGFTGLGGGDVDTRQAFLALRRELGTVGDRRTVVGHLGAQYSDIVDGISRHQVQPYAGLEVGLGGRLTFAAEGRPRMNREFGTPLALTVVYRASRSLRLAVTWANNGMSGAPKFGFGAGYALGSRR